MQKHHFWMRYQTSSCPGPRKDCGEEGSRLSWPDPRPETAGRAQPSRGAVRLPSPAAGIAQRSRLPTPAPRPLPTGREDDGTGRSGDRVCRDLGTRRPGRLRLRPSGPAPGSRLAAPRRLLPSGSQASRRLRTLSPPRFLALAACSALREKEEKGTKMSCRALPAPSGLITQRCAFP